MLAASDIFGSSIDEGFGYGIRALNDCRVLFCRRVEFDALASQEPALEHLLLHKTLDALDRGREWLQVLAAPKAVTRLASFLLIYCRDATSAGMLGMSHRPNVLQIRLPMRRADLAHYLGTRAESLSRAIHALHDDGVIRINTPNDLDILDLSRLAAVASLELSAQDLNTLCTVRNASVMGLRSSVARRGLERSARQI